MEIIKYFEKGEGLLLFSGILVLVLAAVYFAAVKSSKKEYTGKILIPVFFIELSVFFAVLTLGFPDKGDEVGPGVVPGLWITSIFLLGVFLLVKTLLGFEEKDPGWGKISAVFIIIGATVLYLLIMQLIGYFASTAMYLIFGMYYLKYRNWKVMISLTAGWIIFSYFIFYKLLFVPLPAGILVEQILG